MKKFKIGEEVVALSTQTGEGFQRRIKGAVYPVKRIIYCSKCGDQLINISDATPNSNYGVCPCGGVNEFNGSEYTNAKHFGKTGGIHAQIKEAEEAENYELAGFLLSTLNEMG